MVIFTIKRCVCFCLFVLYSFYQCQPLLMNSSTFKEKIDLECVFNFKKLSAIQSVGSAECFNQATNEKMFTKFSHPTRLSYRLILPDAFVRDNAEITAKSHEDITVEMSTDNDSSYGYVYLKLVSLHKNAKIFIKLSADYKPSKPQKQFEAIIRKQYAAIMRNLRGMGVALFILIVALVYALYC